ncbi:MAG: DUF2061 domain-containing protein [Candidatus Paceibacterota bacterium]|jgi:uncharacterized membrane protein
METKTRSWVKSIAWRIIGIFLLGYITYLVTGNSEQTTTITVLFHGIRVIMYYYHERLWLKINWGTNNETFNNHALPDLGQRIAGLDQKGGR